MSKMPIWCKFLDFSRSYLKAFHFYFRVQSDADFIFPPFFRPTYIVWYKSVSAPVTYLYKERATSAIRF